MIYRLGWCREENGDPLRYDYASSIAGVESVSRQRSAEGWWPAGEIEETATPRTQIDMLALLRRWGSPPKTDHTSKE